MDIQIQAQLAEYAGLFKAVGQGPWLPLLFVLACLAGYLLTRKGLANRTLLSVLVASSAFVGVIQVIPQTKALGLLALFPASLCLFASLFALKRESGK